MYQQDKSSLVIILMSIIVILFPTLLLAQLALVHTFKISADSETPIAKITIGVDQDFNLRKDPIKIHIQAINKGSRTLLVPNTESQIKLLTSKELREGWLISTITLPQTGSLNDDLFLNILNPGDTISYLVSLVFDSSLVNLHCIPLGRWMELGFIWIA